MLTTKDIGLQMYLSQQTDYYLRVVFNEVIQTFTAKLFMRSRDIIVIRPNTTIMTHVLVEPLYNEEYLIRQSFLHFPSLPHIYIVHYKTRHL